MQKWTPSLVFDLLTWPLRARRCLNRFAAEPVTLWSLLSANWFCHKRWHDVLMLTMWCMSAVQPGCAGSERILLHLLRLHGTTLTKLSPLYPGSRLDHPAVWWKTQNPSHSAKILRDGLHRSHVDHWVEQSRGLGGAAHRALQEPVNAPGLLVAALRHTGTPGKPTVYSEDYSMLVCCEGFTWSKYLNV